MEKYGELMEIQSNCMRHWSVESGKMNAQNQTNSLKNSGLPASISNTPFSNDNRPHSILIPF